MSSLIHGFEYDIFISYRQKDNKYDGWVTEFVSQLKGELESTFKEDISVYFDINPHDGLLETHDVDASLKEKLKCLIFIPIISRTYCDPKSFAWEHEFKAFIDQASKDQFGLKVKLPNGNVANRVLPIQIHDLYPEDKTTIEKELGGILRAIEFIYKEPGVNRPLTVKDNEDKNTNKTNYRNQINKVANALDEVIHGIRSNYMSPADRNTIPDQNLTIAKEDRENELQKEKILSGKNIKRWVVSGLLVLLCIAGVFGILKVIEIKKQADDITNLEKSLAVLPFVNDSPDKENEYFCNGMMDEILNNLQKIKDFRVLSRTSVEQYRGTSKPTIPKIAKALNVNYIVEGSLQKYDNTFRLRVQLIAANNERHLWGKSYEQEITETKDIFKIQSNVAQSIAEELRATITPEENLIITKSLTPNLDSYNLFYQARNEHFKFWMGNCRECLQKAMILYCQALQYDSTFAQIYSGLAWGYLSKYYVEGLNENFMDSVLIYVNKAIKYNDKLDEAHIVKGSYYANTGDYSMSLKEYNEAIKLNPNYSLAYFFRGGLFFYKIFDQINGFEDYFMALQLEYGPYRPLIMRSIGVVLGNFGYPEMAKYYLDESLKLDKDSIDYFNSITFLNKFDNPTKALELSSEVLKRDPANLTALWNELFSYERLGKYQEALQIALKIIQLNKEKGIEIQSGLEYIGYAFLKTGQTREAKLYFDKQISIIEKKLKLDPLSDAPKLALSRIYATLGKKEEALQILNVFRQQDRERRSKGGIMGQIYFYMLKYEPLYENLHSEPMFQDYVNEVESNYKTDFEKLNLWLKNKGVLKE